MQNDIYLSNVVGSANFKNNTIKKAKIEAKLEKNKTFNLFLNTHIDKTISNIIYVYAFNIWIEDNNSMDKTMASIGHAFDNINKVKSLINKR